MLEKLRKQGVDPQPVECITGRAIARSFWGKAWCRHLDSFGDYDNRLPRGRTYVRNGSVCHLAIGQGRVDALVSGSTLYSVEITIAPLPAADWDALKKQCAGKIGSLLELLQGRLSEEIMRIVTDRDHGLFPKPKQITYHCNCADWASMCKHIAAVIYGIGARLDENPQLLFLLRGVDHEELIDADAASAARVVSGGNSQRARRRGLAAGSLEDVFGIELDQADASPAPARTAPPGGNAKSAATSLATAPATSTPIGDITGPDISRLRHKLGLSKAAFAREIGVSQPTISNWEIKMGIIQARATNLDSLRRLFERSARD
jgi:uncharacterized Zn finger protein